MATGTVLNMSPGVTAHDLPHGLMRQPVEAPNRTHTFAVVPFLAYAFHLAFSHLRLANLRTAWNAAMARISGSVIAPLRPHVRSVVLGRTEEEVIGPNAGGRITSVQNPHARRDEPNEHPVGNAVRQSGSTGLPT